MGRLYDQGETFYPFFLEPDSSLTSVSMLIVRDDGYFFDFNDSTFKDTGWTTKEQALTEKTEGVWVYAAGWTIPSADRTYRVYFKDNSGYVYDGPEIQVGAANVGNLDAAVSSRSSHAAADVWTAGTRTITGGTITSNGDKTGYALSAAGVDSIHDEVVEGAMTFRQMKRVELAALAGKSSGGGTSVLKFRDAGDTKDRISATVDASGNRTAVTLDGA